MCYTLYLIVIYLCFESHGVYLVLDICCMFEMLYFFSVRSYWIHHYGLHGLLRCPGHLSWGMGLNKCIFLVNSRNRNILHSVFILKLMECSKLKLNTIKDFTIKMEDNKSRVVKNYIEKEF